MKYKTVEDWAQQIKNPNDHPSTSTIWEPSEKYINKNRKLFKVQCFQKIAG